METHEFIQAVPRVVTRLRDLAFEKPWLHFYPEVNPNRMTLTVDVFIADHISIRHMEEVEVYVRSAADAEGIEPFRVRVTFRPEEILDLVTLHELTGGVGP